MDLNNISFDVWRNFMALTVGDHGNGKQDLELFFWSEVISSFRMNVPNSWRSDDHSNSISSIQFNFMKQIVFLF